MCVCVHLSPVALFPCNHTSTWSRGLLDRCRGKRKTKEGCVRGSGERTELPTASWALEEGWRGFTDKMEHTTVEESWAPTFILHKLHIVNLILSRIFAGWEIDVMEQGGGGEKGKIRLREKLKTLKKGRERKAKGVFPLGVLVRCDKFWFI